MSSYSYDGKVPVIIFRIRGGESGLEDFGGSHGFRRGGGRGGGGERKKQGGVSRY